MSKQNTVEKPKRSYVDLSENEINQIAEIVKYGRKSYRTIKEEFNLNSLSIINKIKIKFVECIETTGKRKRKPMKESTKKKLQEAALAHKFWGESELIIGKHLDVLEGIIWGVKNLKSITDEQKEENDKIVKFLNGVYEEVSNNMHTFTKEQEKGKNKLVRDIYLALTKVSQFVYGKQLMISAIDKLREYLKFYNDKEMEVKVFKQVKEMLEAFFQGAQTLDIENYLKFKQRVIELSRYSQKYFDQYEDID